MKSRRTLLKQSVLSGGVLLSGLHRVHLPDFDPGSRNQGSLAGLVPFSDEDKVPVNQSMGTELDGRLFTDLSTLTPENAVTPTENFYIRTRASTLLDTSKLWSIQIGGLVEKPTSISVAELRKAAKPMGLHLMECAGNFRGAHFGMISVADWRGVRLRNILEGLKPAPPAARILLSGFDQYAYESSTSVPGASWVFTSAELSAAGAFLATEMNGQPLTPDHGSPVRLVVPGWYGCACIKWLNEISFVPDDAPATTQMQEYAARTMQRGLPHLARDNHPATIDCAAMPIRIEKWFVNEKIEFHIIGIQWGGANPIAGLEIQCNPDESYAPVQDFHPSKGDTWNFWRFRWTPQKSGNYAIRLRPKGQTVPARRLNTGYYVRSVEIKDL
jgi:DMSO/TMAO reductase YedYZ molybdopterin-dependent catalytic subunit